MSQRPAGVAEARGSDSGPLYRTPMHMPDRPAGRRPSWNPFRSSKKSAALSTPEIAFDGQNCEDFILKIRRYAFSQGKEEDDRWTANYAATCIAGDALRWFEGLDSETQTSWRLLRRALLAHHPNSTDRVDPRSVSLVNQIRDFIHVDPCIESTRSYQLLPQLLPGRGQRRQRLRSRRPTSLNHFSSRTPNRPNE